MSNNGSALLFSMLILSVILGVGLSVSTIVSHNISSARDVGLIISSFSAANAGVERMLYRIRKTGVPPGVCQGTSGQTAICAATSILSFSPDISYTTHIYEPGFGDPSVGTCPGATPTWCIFSKGTFQDISRSIQVSF